MRFPCFALLGLGDESPLEAEATGHCVDLQLSVRSSRSSEASVFSICQPKGDGGPWRVLVSAQPILDQLA